MSNAKEQVRLAIYMVSPCTKPFSGSRRAAFDRSTTGWHRRAGEKQPLDERAKLAVLNLGYMTVKDVELDCFKDGRHGRSVCKVMVAPASAPDGPLTLDAGLAMVTMGMAW